MKYCAWLLAYLLFTFAVFGDDKDHNHKDLTTAQLGTVHFPVSCVPAVQKPFERGVALLHSFWYEEAEREFEEIGKVDPQCAMAHWGIAMSLWHQIWDEPTSAILKRGGLELKEAQSLHPATSREQDYIAALGTFYEHPQLAHHERAIAYSVAMGNLSEHFPDDHEAAAFYALSLLAAEGSSPKAIAILETLFGEEPNHPGVAHYLIHAYDVPGMAEQGLPAARRYAQIAPASPHALHMPSHIFARLGLWQEDIDSNVAAIAAAQKEVDMHMGGEVDQLHAVDFLVYAYLQSGREANAQKAIDDVRAMPSTNDVYGPARLFVLSALPGSYALELHHWSDAASLKPLAGAASGMQAITYIASAIGAARMGNLDQARHDLNQLQSIVRELAKSDKEVSGGVERELQIVIPWIDHLEGKDVEALRLLRSLADKEQGVSEANQGIPPREMLGDMLLELKRPEEAFAEYVAELKMNPNRFNSLYGAGRAAELAGKIDQAMLYYGQLLTICQGSNSERPELIHAKRMAKDSFRLRSQ